MIETNYYATVRYRGKEKFYHVTAEDSENGKTIVRLEYVDYDAKRQYDCVWVDKNRIVYVFDKNTPQYEYFELLKTNFYCNVQSYCKNNNIKCEFGWIPIGTFYAQKCFNEALKNTSKNF